MQELNRKFNRKYLLAIQYGETKGVKQETLESGEVVDRIFFNEGNGELVIRPFFTIKFTIDRGVYASINKITLDIYNLSKATRERIYYDGILHAAVAKKIVLYAGYSNEDFSKFNSSIITNSIKSSIQGLPLVFHGRFTRAYSYRQGSDFITHIEAFDLPEKNEINISTEFKKGTNEKTMINYLANQLGLSEKNVIIDNDFKFELKRNKSFGNKTVWEAVDDMVNSVNSDIKKEKGDNAPLFRLYYDYPNLVVLRDDKYLKNAYTLIDSNTGLLSTPIREGAKVTFRTLFEPSFRCGGYVDLNSRTTQSGINGILKVIGYKHQGTNSPVVSESLTTDFTCFLGIDKLKAE